MLRHRCLEANVALRSDPCKPQKSRKNFPSIGASFRDPGTAITPDMVMLSCPLGIIAANPPLLAKGSDDDVHRPVHQAIRGPPPVNGQSSYKDDMMRPGMLHALIIRSPHGHARIRGIDASAALALSGMAAVITAQHIEEAARQT